MLRAADNFQHIFIINEKYEQPGSWSSYDFEFHVENDCKWRDLFTAHFFYFTPHAIELSPRPPL